MGKPKERLLLTWNEQKHPEIVEFFNSIEQGLYSHYVREAIKFYMKHKGNENKKISTEGYENSFQVESQPDNKGGKEVEKENIKNDYVEFDPNDL